MELSARFAFAPNDSLSEYSIVNIGEGIAKDITIEWEKRNVKTLNDYLIDKDDSFSRFYIEDEAGYKFDFGETLFMTNSYIP